MIQKPDTKHLPASSEGCLVKGYLSG